jgi:two-component system, NarL family, response regulator DegU
MPITVEIADHEEMRRSACLHLLQQEQGIAVVGEAKNAPEALRAVEQLKPDILLLSMSLLARQEITLVSTLRRMSPGTKVILLTHCTAEAQILKALSHGASGCIEEEILSRLLLKAVRLVSAGEAWVPRRLVNRIIEFLTAMALQDPTVA